MHSYVCIRLCGSVSAYVKVRVFVFIEQCLCVLAFVCQCTRCFVAYLCMCMMCSNAWLRFVCLWMGVCAHACVSLLAFVLTCTHESNRSWTCVRMWMSLASVYVCVRSETHFVHLPSPPPPSPRCRLAPTPPLPLNFVARSTHYEIGLQSQFSTEHVFGRDHTIWAAGKVARNERFTIETRFGLHHRGGRPALRRPLLDFPQGGVRARGGGTMGVVHGHPCYWHKVTPCPCACVCASLCVQRNSVCLVFDAYAGGSLFMCFRACLHLSLCVHECIIL